MTQMQRGPARAYDFATHGTSSRSQQQGNHLVRPGVVQVWAPPYGGGFQLVRPLPSLDRSNPTQPVLTPYRRSSGVNQFGDWIRRYPVCQMGDPGVKFIMFDPAVEQTIDVQMLPGWVLFNAIDRAVATGNDQRGWGALIRGAQGRRAVLAKPDELYMFQSLILHHKQKSYPTPIGLAPDALPVLSTISGGAGRSLLEHLNLVNPNYQGPDGDWEQQFVYGDPISLTTGRFFGFYKTADGDPRVQQQQQSAGWNMQPSHQQQQQQGTIGYSAFIDANFGAIRASGLSEPTLAQYVVSRLKAWDDFLYFPTVAEQALLLADKFPADVIMYAWRDHPDWIPEAIRDRMRNAVSVNFGGAPSGYATGYGAPAAPASPYGLGGPPGTPGYTSPMPLPPGFGMPTSPPADGQYPPPGGMPTFATAPQFGASPPAAPPGYGAPPAPPAPPAGPYAQVPLPSAPLGAMSPPPAAPPGYGAPPPAAPPGYGAPPPAAPAFGGYGAPPPPAAPPGYGAPPHGATPMGGPSWPGGPPRPDAGMPGAGIPAGIPAGFAAPPAGGPPMGGPPNALPGYPPQAAAPPMAGPPGNPPPFTPPPTPYTAPPAFSGPPAVAASPAAAGMQHQPGAGFAPMPPAAVPPQGAAMPPMPQAMPPQGGQPQAAPPPQAFAGGGRAAAALAAAQQVPVAQ